MGAARSASVALGDAGEDAALRLLHEHGYAEARKLQLNTPVVDIEVGGRSPFACL